MLVCVYVCVCVCVHIYKNGLHPIYQTDMDVCSMQVELSPNNYFQELTLVYINKSNDNPETFNCNEFV